LNHINSSSEIVFAEVSSVRGVFDYVYRKILNWFGNKDDISLTVVVYNGRAQSFYQKLGFEVIPGSKHFHKGTVITVVDMIRKGEK